MDENDERALVEQFIFEKIDSVPQLEALLLIWSRRPKVWLVNEMSSAIYVSAETTLAVLRDLVAKGLAAEEPEGAGQYLYRSQSAEWENFMELLDRTYRHELIRISKLIHSFFAAARETGAFISTGANAIPVKLGLDLDDVCVVQPGTNNSANRVAQTPPSFAARKRLACVVDVQPSPVCHIFRRLCINLHPFIGEILKGQKPRKTSVCR